MIEIIKEIEQLLEIPLGLLLAICHVESNHRNIHNLNDFGSPSYGPCQIKLETARLFNPRLTGKDLYKPKKSVYYAGLYLKKQLKRYNEEDCAIASYNSGTCKFKKEKIRNYYYVRKVKEKWRGYCPITRIINETTEWTKHDQKMLDYSK